MTNPRTVPYVPCVPLVPALLLLLATLAYSFPIQRDTLPNGLAILTSEDHRLPLVRIQLAVRGGSAADPIGQEGLADLTGKLLARGTRTRTATAIRREIEFVGGNLDVSTDADHTRVGVQVLAKDLDRALELLADIVRNPVFSDSELVRARQENTGEIQRQQDEPFDVLYNEFFRRLYGNHPYGHPVIGWDFTVRDLGRAQVLAFYGQWYVPGNCYVTAVGDFDADTLRAKLAARLGDWPGRAVPEISIPMLPRLDRPRGMMISRPEMNQAYVLLGHYGIREGSVDVFPCRLMNFMLGGSGSTSRIMRAVREERGLAYDARSGFDRRKLGGAFYASTQIRTDSVQRALDVILEQLRLMREQGTTAAELARTRDYYLGNFPLEHASSRDKLAALDRIELFGLGLDYLDRYADNIRGVTEADIQRVARDHVFPDRYVLIVAGNLEEKDINLPGLEWLR